jgi:hypothetical protein
VRPGPGSAIDRPLLALPDDERWITVMLRERFGYLLVHSSLGGEEVGTVVEDPLAFLPDELPSALHRREHMVAGLGTLATYTEMWDLSYWAEELGQVPVRRQPDPPLLASRPDWPLRMMIAYPPPAPLLRLRRSFWHIDGECVVAGDLYANDAFENFFAPAIAAVRVECLQIDTRESTPRAARPTNDEDAIIDALPCASDWLLSGRGRATAFDFVSVK